MTANNNNIKRMVIVGGGTAGWMTAAALSKVLGREKLEITLIESDQVGIVGVGEATIPPIVEFNKLLGIDADEMLRETQGTFKLGIEFHNWGSLGRKYMHPFGVFGRTIRNVNFWHYWKKAYDLGISPDLEAYSLNWIAAKQNRFMRSVAIQNSPLSNIPHAYHFDASLYASFLRKFSENLGVTRVEGLVEEVQQHPDSGFIRGIRLADSRVVEGDFFFDCTGFRGLLIEQCLQTGYEDWSNYLPCNSALAVPSDAITPRHPYTVSTAHEFGWQWRIPLQHRTGNGIVYSNDFGSDEDARFTLLANLPSQQGGEPRQLRFKTGKRKRSWNKNCLAIGLASGFMEPLESTSIHLIQSSIMRFFSVFPKRSNFGAEMASFNRAMDEEQLSIRDFLVLHYKATQRDDSEFWRYCRNMPIPDSLQHKLELYQSGSWLARNKQELFGEDSWLAVLEGQHVKAQGYSPLVDSMPDPQLETILRETREVLKQCAGAMPDHDTFIEKQCAAPPLQA
jgi:tryptophan halogenase